MKRKSKGEHYPQDFNVPKEIVLAKREARKKRKQAAKLVKRPRPPKQKKIKNEHCGTIHNISFTVPLESKQFHLPHPDYEARVSVSKRHRTVNLQIKEPNRFYLDWFWACMRKRTFDPLMMISLFPDVKEITESAAALFGMRAMLELKESHVVVVGDGNTCRTGALFAHCSKFITSVDPCLNVIKCENRPLNVEISKMTIQDWVKDWNANGIDSLAIVAVHAHVCLQDYVRDLLHKCGHVPKIVLLTIECCVPQFLEVSECKEMGLHFVNEYDDWGIHSPCRKVKRWVRTL